MSSQNVDEFNNVILISSFLVLSMMFCRERVWNLYGAFTFLVFFFNFKSVYTRFVSVTPIILKLNIFKLLYKLIFVLFRFLHRVKKTLRRDKLNGITVLFKNGFRVFFFSCYFRPPFETEFVDVFFSYGVFSFKPRSKPLLVHTP